MNFQKLINFASKNHEVQKKTGQKVTKRYSTNLPPPKKEERKKGQLSAAVRSFLEKKELEEKKKAEEEELKKKELLKLRAKANTMKKARAMATRTKDNLKKWTDEELIAMKEEEKQKILEKEMKKVDFSKKERRVSNARMTDSEIKQLRERALKKAKGEIISDDESSPDKIHKKDKEKEKPSTEVKTKHNEKLSNSKSEKPSSKSREGDSSKKTESSSSHHSKHDNADNKKSKHLNENKTDKPKPKPKPKRTGPPPMSFDQVLKMANDKLKGPSSVMENKQSDPAESKPDQKTCKTPKLPNRPMTQEEKERWLRTHSPEYIRFLKFGGKRPDLGTGKDESKDGTENDKSKGKNQGKSIITTKNMDNLKDTHSKSQRPGAFDLVNNLKKPPPNVVATQRSYLMSGKSNKDIPNPKPDSLKRPHTLEPHLKSAKTLKLEPKVKTAKDVQHLASKSNFKLSKSKSLTSYTENENVLECGKPAPRPKHQMSPESDRRNISKESKVSTWDKIYSDLKKKKPTAAKRPNVIDSDEDEYDDDMDSFIEDGDDDDSFIDDGDAGNDYSSYIKDIFGYDKSKYKYDDEDDLADMETNFATQMKEEAISAKIGLKEDLEDMRLEEEEKRRKLVKKKAMKKRQ